MRFVPRVATRTKVAALSVVLAPVLLLSGVSSTASATLSNSTPQTTWGTNGRVLAILPAGRRVYVAGSFTAVVNGSGAWVPVHNLAVYRPASGTFNTSWHPNPNGEVDALGLSKGHLYLGGAFTRVHGRSRGHLAELSADTGRVARSWKPRANGLVRALAIGHRYIYVGGKFSRLADAAGSHRRYYLGRIGRGHGRVSGRWRPHPNAQVRSLALSNKLGRLYVAGNFTSISGHTHTRYVASLAARSGRPVRDFAAADTNTRDRAPSPSDSLYLSGSRLIVGVMGFGGACTSLNATTGRRQWSIWASGNIQAVTVRKGIVYCGGHFGGPKAFGGHPRHKLGAVGERTGHVLSFQPRFNSALGVWALGRDRRHVYVGGDFTKVNSKTHPHLAVFAQ